MTNYTLIGSGEDYEVFKTSHTAPAVGGRHGSGYTSGAYKYLCTVHVYLRGGDLGLVDMFINYPSEQQRDGMLLIAKELTDFSGWSLDSNFINDASTWKVTAARAAAHFVKVWFFATHQWWHLLRVYG